MLIIDAYNKIKGSITEKKSILLYRLGDFYEAFGGDAELLRAEIGAILSKYNGVFMAGFLASDESGGIQDLKGKGYSVFIMERKEGFPVKFKVGKA